MEKLKREIQICGNGNWLVGKIIFSGHEREGFIGKHDLSLSYVDIWIRGRVFWVEMIEQAKLRKQKGIKES